MAAHLDANLPNRLACVSGLIEQVHLDLSDIGSECRIELDRRLPEPH